MGEGTSRWPMSGSRDRTGRTPTFPRELPTARWRASLAKEEKIL